MQVLPLAAGDGANASAGVLSEVAWVQGTSSGPAPMQTQDIIGKPNHSSEAPLSRTTHESSGGCGASPGLQDVARDHLANPSDVDLALELEPHLAHSAEP